MQTSRSAEKIVAAKIEKKLKHFGACREIFMTSLFFTYSNKQTSWKLLSNKRKTCSFETKTFLSILMAFSVTGIENINYYNAYNEYWHQSYIKKFANLILKENWNNGHSFYSEYLHIVLFPGNYKIHVSAIQHHS